MHIVELNILVGAAAIMPIYISCKLYSLLRVSGNAKTVGAQPEGVVYSKPKLLPAFLENAVKSAFKTRDKMLRSILVGFLPPSSKILDVGCNDGSLLAQLKESGFDVQGVDLDDASVATAMQVIGIDRIRRGDLLDTWQGEDRFSAILFCDTIRYTTRPNTLLSHALKLSPIVIITEPHWYWHTFGRVLFLRFLYRVGHLSRLPVELYPIESMHRTFWHNIWIIKRDTRMLDSPELNKLIENEANWMLGSLMHPEVQFRLRSAFILSLIITIMSIVILATTFLMH